MRIADRKVVRMDHEGVMCCATFDSDNNFITLRINGAVQATGFSTLLPSGVFEDKGHKVNLEGPNSNIEMRGSDGETKHILPLRQVRRLKYLH